MKERPRSGRRLEVSEETFAEIRRRELSENLSGWKTKEIMNIIYERTGVRYHEVYIYTLLHKCGFKPKVPRKKFINTASKEEEEEKEQFKNSEEIISTNIPEEVFTLLVEDESTFVHDAQEHYA